jgi:hypothetical protein
MVVARIGETFVEFPPIQKPASFNLEAVKEQIRHAHSKGSPLLEEHTANIRVF